MTRRISALKRNSLAVIVYPRIKKARWRIARQFGLTVDDFMWISETSKWWQHIRGINRSMLVLDPFDVVAGAPDYDLFAAAIISSFDHVACSADCAARLADQIARKQPYSSLAATRSRGTAPAPGAIPPGQSWTSTG